MNEIVSLLVLILSDVHSATYIFVFIYLLNVLGMFSALHLRRHKCQLAEWILKPADLFLGYIPGCM